MPFYLQYLARCSSSCCHLSDAHLPPCLALSFLARCSSSCCHLPDAHLLPCLTLSFFARCSDELHIDYRLSSPHSRVVANRISRVRTPINGLKSLVAVRFKPRPHVLLCNSKRIEKTVSWICARPTPFWRDLATASELSILIAPSDSLTTNP